MSPLWSLVPVVLASLANVAAAFSAPDACGQFKLNLPNVELNSTTYFPPNATVSITTLQASINATNLPAFCRVQLVLTTNMTAGSTALTELWLPDDWNGRLLTVGNGGMAGGGM